MRLYYILILPFLILLASCSSSSGEDKGSFTLPTQVDMKSYNEGQKLYTNYCKQCHQDKGQGAPPTFPPLAKSDYLMADRARAACIIKNGSEGPITVNGQEYRLKMVGHKDLTAQQIADILTFVTNSWGNEGGTMKREDVVKALETCK